MPESTPASRFNRFAGTTSYILLLGFIAYFLLTPAIICLTNVKDPALRGPGIPKIAGDIFTNLSPKYEAWCRMRVAKAAGAEVDREDISGTEWPVFGSYFYLLAVENMQKEWEDGDYKGAEPKRYAAGAIKAATELILDPSHGNWVKEHWGKDYLTKENAFYRMLQIGAITVYTKLTDDKSKIPELKKMTKLLAESIDKSKYGLIDDYPNQCYPADVLTAIAMIKRSGELTGDDYSKFIERSKRGFSGKLLDNLGLPPYGCSADSGDIFDIGRGCGNSYVNIFAPEIYPQKNKEWYDIYVKHFWQDKNWGAGFREFPKEMKDREWYYDVDSGPVVCGYGFAASAFGIAAARINGRFDQAWPMSAEALVSSWPLASGTLLGPRILSNAADAPFLGEACMLFILTTQPYDKIPILKGGHIPGYFYVIFSAYFIAALWLGIPVLRDFRYLMQGRKHFSTHWLQGVIWSAGLLAIAINFYTNTNNLVIFVVAFLLMLVFPRTVLSKKNNKGSSSAADKYNAK